MTCGGLSFPAGNIARMPLSMHANHTSGPTPLPASYSTVTNNNAMHLSVSVER